jgi:hypothetical protein
MDPQNTLRLVNCSHEFNKTCPLSAYISGISGILGKNIVSKFTYSVKIVASIMFFLSCLTRSLAHYITLEDNLLPEEQNVGIIIVVLSSLVISVRKIIYHN